MGPGLARWLLNKSPEGDEEDSEKGGLRVDESRTPEWPTPHVADLTPKERCDIQPHTDDGGDAYYIGDFDDSPKVAHEWALNDSRPRPYLNFVKRVSTQLPHLEYLAHWMEVSCAPPKWKYIKGYPPNREARAARCNISVLNFNEGQKVHTSNFDNTSELKAALDIPLVGTEKPPIRLLIVEDLSRDVIELLGEKYDIDPLFFLSHIGDYLFHNTRDRWVELPDLDVDARQRSHFNVQYLRARYFKKPEEFEQAERSSGAFNVLRRLDSDRSRKRLQDSLLDVKGASVTLTRSKTSLWVQERKTEQDPIIAVLLVDPTVREGIPLWGGYRPFSNTPSMRSAGPIEAPTHESLFEDAVYWSSRMSASDLDSVRDNPRAIAVPMLRLVLADWRTVIKYMATMLGKIEWEFEGPHWGEKPSDVDISLKKLSPWRRNVPYYQGMIGDAIERIFQVSPDVRSSHDPKDPEPSRPILGLRSLLHDFHLVQQLMNASQKRIETIQTTASNSINIEEARRAVNQNENLARITFLATAFIPLSFTSSFLSMSPDFTKATETIWLFFTIGVPLTLAAVIMVDLMRPQGYIARKGRLLQNRWRALRKKPAKSLPPEGATKVQIGKTMPWPTSRTTSDMRMEARG